MTAHRRRSSVSRAAHWHRRTPRAVWDFLRGRPLWQLIVSAAVIVILVGGGGWLLIQHFLNKAREQRIAEFWQRIDQQFKSNDVQAMKAELEALRPLTPQDDRIDRWL